MKIKLKILVLAVISVVFNINAQAQVGVGTNSPTATLHVKSENSLLPSLFKVDDATNTTHFRINNTGKIFVTPPVIDNSITNLFGIDPIDNSIKLISKSSLGGTGIPTGLERINEGTGPGWRLIGRDPLNYGNIAYGAVDFSEANSPSNEFGAGITYSFIGPGFDNTIIDTSGEESSISNAILGGNENIITNSPSNNTAQVSIFGGSRNVAHITSESSVILGNENFIEINSYGNILGNDNFLGVNTTGTQLTRANIFGSNNTVEENSLYSSNPFSGNVSIIGDYNSVSSGTSAYIFGLNNTATSPSEFSSFLIGNRLKSQLPYEVVVGCYSENPSESVGGDIKDPVFRVGIGYVTDVNGKDGFRVYRDGKVEIRQVPQFDDLSEEIYCRNTIDGTMALIEANKLTASSGYIINVPIGTVNSAYLNANFGGKAVFTRVYNTGDNTLYTYVAGGVWVKNSVTTVP